MAFSGAYSLSAEQKLSPSLMKKLFPVQVDMIEPHMYSLVLLLDNLHNAGII